MSTPPTPPTPPLLARMLPASWWYVGAVKLLFCALSLAIPAGMYFFSRRHFGEAAARAALLAGALWYELVGFAHKRMTLIAYSVVDYGALTWQTPHAGDHPPGHDRCSFGSRRCTLASNTLAPKGGSRRTLGTTPPNNPTRFKPLAGRAVDPRLLPD